MKFRWLSFAPCLTTHKGFAFRTSNGSDLQSLRRNFSAVSQEGFSAIDREGLPRRSVQSTPNEVLVHAISFFLICSATFQTIA